MQIRKSSYISTEQLPALRALIRECPDEDAREEGLACLEEVKEGEYLINLIPQNHPNRVRIVRWLIGQWLD